MLPTALARGVRGERTRQDAPASQTEQLVGRSRNERLLDRIYNRQGRALREAERLRRWRALRAARVSKQSRQATGHSEGKHEPCIKKQKTEDDGRGDTASSSAAPPPPPGESSADPPSVLNSLIRFTGNKAKLPKVIRLALQLIESGFHEQYRTDFIDFLAALALSPVVTAVPAARADIVSSVRNIRRVCLNESDPPKIPTDPDVLYATADDPISEGEWVQILCCTPLWHNLLLTDDTYQFHQALGHIDTLTKMLPPLRDEDMTSDVRGFTSVTESLFESLLHRRGARPRQATTAAPSVKVEQEEAVCPSGASSARACPTSEPVFPLGVSRPAETGGGGATTTLGCPLRKLAYEIQREAISQVLATLHSYGKTRWSRAAVMQYFQYVYLNRTKLFRAADCVRIEQFQASLLSETSRVIGRLHHQPLSVGEAAHPVRDGREEKIVAVHGAAVWSAKQLGL